MSKDIKKLPAIGYRLLVFLIPVFSALAVEGQSVGLVLSGGGAKGLYHVGVLKALEENNIPVDYITGTSMGAIVGGLYAVGVTPEKMVEEFTNPQVRYWATGEIDPRYNFFYKQSEPNAAWLPLHLDPTIKGSRASLSSTLVSSEQMDLALLEYFTAANAAAGGDFDKLMIPFRSVATNIASRQPVVLRSGDLGLSIRASMSYPLVYGYVKLDSLTLFDGGMVDNFPWRTMVEDFNPDIIIGSSCLFPDSTVNSLESIIDQAMSLVITATDYTLPADKGILIGRNMSSVSLMDFDRAAYTIQRGYEDAMAMMDSIKSVISRRTSELDMQLRREEFESRKPPFILESYNFSGLDAAQTEYVRRLLKLDSPTADEPIISFEHFRTQYLRALSGGEFEGSFPEVTYSPETHMFSILLSLKPKPSLKMMFGGNISSSALTQAYIGLEYRQIRKSSQSYNFDGYFSPFYVSATLSARYDFSMFVPLSLKLYGSYNYYNYFRSNFGFVSKGNTLSYLKHGDIYAGVKISTPLTRTTVFSLYANVAQNTFRYYQQPEYDDNTPLDRTVFSSINTMAAIERNSIPNAFSNRGTFQSISYIFIRGRESYVSGIDETDRFYGTPSYWYGVRFTRESYLPFRTSKWFSLGYLVDMTYTTHADFFFDFATMATSPAFTPTPHSKIVYMKEFRAESFAAGGLIPTISFLPNIYYLKLGAYVFFPRSISMMDPENRAKPRYMFDGSLVYQSLVGPVSLSLSKYGISNNNWFLTFNFGYIIFNKKSLFY